MLGLATLLGEDGRPMHKSWGNSIEFNEAADKIGVDVMRWMYAKQNPADNLKFGYGALKESERKLMNLWNSFTFFKTYATSATNDLKIMAKKSDFGSDSGRSRTSDSNLSLLDQWILSRLSNLTEKVAKNIDKYNPAFAARAIEEFFIEDLSLWYIRRSRERFQRPKTKKEKEIAIKTLYSVLLDLSKVISPFLPFLAEEIYLFLKIDF